MGLKEYIHVLEEAVISIDSFTTVLIQALWSFSGKEVYLKLELYISQGQFSQEILDLVNIGNGVQINWKEVANAEAWNRAGRRSEVCSDRT